MNTNYYSEAAKSILGTIIAMGCSFLITVLISVFVPVSIGASDKVQIDTTRTYTRDEIERAQPIIREKIREETEKLRQAGNDLFFTLFQESKKNSIWFVWIPFFILPFTVSAKMHISIVPIVALTAAAAFVGLFSIKEVLAFCIASICGFLLKYFGSTRNRGTPTRAANGDNS